MLLIDSARMENLGEGLQVGANALLHAELLAQAREYKKQVASRYRLLYETEIKHIAGNNLKASLKLDGQLHFLAKVAGEVILFDIKGRVIRGLPLLAAAAQQLKETQQALIPGELYMAAGQQRPRLREVSRALSAEGAAQAKGLAFAAFDLLALDNKPCSSMIFEEKQRKLAQWFASEPSPCHWAQQYDIDPQGLAQLYKKWVVDADQEGIICVDADKPRVYKIKPQHSVDAVILGFTESPESTDSVRALLTGLMRPDGSFQVFTQVGSGFEEDQRRALFTELSATTVASAFKACDRNHTLFTMVRPETVVEIAFHDLIAENAANKPEMKPVLQYSPAAGYQALLPQQFVNVLRPVLQRVRHDKSATPEDLRLSQLQDFVDLDNLNQAAQSLDLAASSVLRREVYSKTTKGLVAVRKFIAWKTNKELIDANYPAYVFCFVDYSPGRKAPLKRVLRSAPSQKGIESIFERFKAAEIKQGWKPA